MKYVLYFAIALLSIPSFSQTYCETGRVDSQFGRIDSVKIQSLYNNRITILENSSTTNPSGYSDFTGLDAPTFYTGKVVIVRAYVSPRSVGNFYISLWVDFNQDGVFSSDEMLDELGMGTGGLLSGGQLPIPENATLGKTRLRISISTENIAEPCGILAAGEVEDYSIIIAKPTITASLDNLSSISIIHNENNFSISNPQGEVFSYTLRSINGQSIRSKTSNSYTETIDFTGISRGLYILDLVTKTQKVSKKIIY